MKDYPNHELLNRGTPDFQIEVYDLSENHPRYNMQYHWHNKYEIIYVAEGSLKLNLNENIVNLSQGESVFIPNGVVHGAVPKDCKYTCVVFAPSILHASQKSRMIMKAHFNYPIIFKDNTLTEEIIRDMTEKTAGYELSVIGRLYMLVYDLFKNDVGNKTLPKTEFEKIKPAMLYIEENYFNYISVKDLAEKCSMSTNYFCSLFKSIANETPIGYITRYRLEKSCEFLLSGMSITDTAYSSGFNDTSYFINVFKKHFGITPKRYKTMRE